MIKYDYIQEKINELRDALQQEIKQATEYDYDELEEVVSDLLNVIPPQIAIVDSIPRSYVRDIITQIDDDIIPDTDKVNCIMCDCIDYDKEYIDVNLAYEIIKENTERYNESEIDTGDSRD